jgi:hypothetical protein
MMSQPDHSSGLSPLELRIMIFWHVAFSCDHEPGYLVSHNWLHTPDCNILSESKGWRHATCHNMFYPSAVLDAGAQ